MQNRETEYEELAEKTALKYHLQADANLENNLREMITNIEADLADFVVRFFTFCYHIFWFFDAQILQKDKGARLREMGADIDKLRVKLAQLRGNSQSKKVECAKLSQAIAQAQRELKSLGTTTQMCVWWF